MASFIQSTAIVFATGFTTVTSGAITTTSGNLLVAHAATYNQNGTVTDSKGNTWTNVAALTSGSGRIRMDYVPGATGGSSHTFTLTCGANDYPTISVQEFSGVDTTSPLTQNKTDFTSGGSTSHTTGTITTAQTGAIVGCGSSAQSTNYSVTSLIPDRELGTSSTTEGLVTGWDTGGAGNYEMAFTTTVSVAARSIVAAFKNATGASSIQPPAGSLTITGAAPLLARSVISTVGSLTLSGVASSVVQGTLITPTVGALTLAGAAPTVSADFRITPTVGALTLTGAAPSLGSTATITPPAGSLTLTGFTPTVVEGAAGNTNIVPGTGVLTINGVAPALLTDFRTTPTVGSLTATGIAPVLLSGAGRIPITGALSLSGLAPTVVLGGVSFVITPPTGSLGLQGQGAQSTTGVLTLTGYPPTLQEETVIIIVKMFGVNIGNPYLLVFLSDGSAYAFRVDTGTPSLIASPGTFSQTGAGDVAVWEGSIVLIVDPATGYWRWPGAGIGSSAPSVETINAPVIALSDVGNVDAGSHSWAVTFVGPAGETGMGIPSVSTILGVASKVQLSSIPVGPIGTTQRKIYRTTANQGSPWKLLDTINDNSTTSYLDNIADGSLGANAPARGAVDAGSHQWAVSFFDGVTESALSNPSFALATAAPNTVVLYNLPIGPIGTTARKIYRNKIADPANFYLVATVGNNTDTTYTDLTADFALGAIFGGTTGSLVSLIDATRVGTTIAVFAGRAWIANNRTVQYTAPNSFNNFSVADAAGSFVMTDSNFVGPIQKLLSALDAMWIYGEAAINQLTNVSVLPDTTTTTFSNVNVSSSLGTIFPQSVVSFLRQIEFASKYGIIQQVGVSPQRISEKIDGTYALLNLDQPVTAGLVVLNEILCYGLMVSYRDPDNNDEQRKIILLVTFDGKWFVGSQGDGLIRMASVEHNGTYRLFGADLFTIRELFVQPHYPIHKLKTPFFDGGDITAGKEMVRTMMVMNFPEATPITSRITPQSTLGPKNPFRAENSNVLQLAPSQGENITVIGADGGQIQMVGKGFQLQQWLTQVNSKMIGFDLQFNSDPFHICGYAIDVITRESWGDET